MMSFEYSTFIEKTKHRFDILLNPKTFWIHFDQDDELHHFRIPTIENLSYVLALLHSHSKECVQNAFDRLARLLKYYVQDVGFPESLHDFPEVKSFNDQILILAILKKIDEMYGKYIREDLHAQLLAVIENLSMILDQKITNPSQKIKFLGLSKQDQNTSALSTKDFGEYLLFRGPRQDSFLDYDYWTDTAHRKSGIEKRNGFYEEFSPFHLVSRFIKGNLDVSKVPNSMVKYLPLLEAKWLTETFLFSQKQSAVLQKAEHIQLSFPNGYSIYFCSIHPIDVQEDKNEMTITIDYPSEPLDEKESLAETQIFISKLKNFKILAGGEKVTTFALDEGVTIIDEHAHQVAKFEFNSSGGIFMGTVSFGNRPSQKKKTFEPYDQIIGVRTVLREPNAKLKIKFQYDSIWNPKDGNGTN